MWQKSAKGRLSPISNMSAQGKDGMARILFQYLRRFQHWLKERIKLKGIRQHFAAACPADGESIQQWPTRPSMTLKA
jgi:hypothetical protein